MCLTRGAGPQGREFTLVFRTFGADVAEVVEEMNSFATGQHPCYPEARLACRLALLEWLELLLALRLASSILHAPLIAVLDMCGGTEVVTRAAPLAWDAHIMAELHTGEWSL